MKYAVKRKHQSFFSIVNSNDRISVTGKTVKKQNYASFLPQEKEN